MYTHAKERAKYRNTDPTLTDQAQAADTDLNVILKKYGMTGKAPGSKMPLPPGDYSNAPEDLRGYIELARSVKEMHESLPPNLRKLTLEQLATLDNKQLAQYDDWVTKQTAQQEDKPNDQGTSNQGAGGGDNKTGK